VAKKPTTSDTRSTTPLDAGPGQPRIALYNRASTTDQDAQLAREALTTWAARQGGEVVLSIEETGSGARNDRPGLQRLLKAAREGEIDVVACWKLDRAGRSALDLLSNIRQLADAGVRFVAITQGIDIKPGSDAMSRLMLTVLAAVAEFERDLIRERTRLGMAKARAKGMPIGRPRIHRVSAQSVVELRAAGKSWTKIAKELRCSVGVARLRYSEGTATQPTQT
jgi:putative DNA-invertase from lambdoid prophage Rac